METFEDELAELQELDDAQLRDKSAELLREVWRLKENLLFATEPPDEWNTVMRTGNADGISPFVFAGQDYIAMYQSAVKMALAISGMEPASARCDFIRALTQALLVHGLVIRLTPRERTRRLMRADENWFTVLRKENHPAHRLIQEAFILFEQKKWLEGPQDRAADGILEAHGLATKLGITHEKIDRLTYKPE